MTSRSLICLLENQNGGKLEKTALQMYCGLHFPFRRAHLCEIPCIIETSYQSFL
jgi:hypothetical protein